MKKVWITTDCTCDLSEDLLEKYGLEVIYFYITTDHGSFKDLEEITANNVVEYFNNGGKRIATAAPEVYEYVEFFESMLQKYEKIVHITISAKHSKSYENAVAASKKFCGRVTVFDSGHLSTGIAHIALRALELAKEGKQVEEIVPELERMKNKVSTSFVVEDIDYLYRTGRVNKFIKDICDTLKIHPVIGMKDGRIGVKTVYIGDYKKAVLRYVRKELGQPEKIKKDRVFIVSSTCPLKIYNLAKKQIKECCEFKETLETKASATITSNCGANAFAVMYVRK